MLGVQDRDALGVARGSLADEQRRAGLDVETAGRARVSDIRGDRLVHGRQFYALEGKDVVEGGALHIAAGELSGVLASHPDRHERERLAVGEIHALDAQHVGVEGDLERAGDLSGGANELESEDSTGCHCPRPFDRGLDRRDPPERLADGIERHEPARTPAGRDEALAA